MAQMFLGLRQSGSLSNIPVLACIWIFLLVMYEYWVRAAVLLCLLVYGET